MTAPAIVGSIVGINSTATSGSQSVTVPAGANACILFTGFWNSSRQLSSASLGGNAFTSEVGSLNASYQMSEAWVLKAPPTGSQTFAWAWNGDMSGADGPIIALVFLQNITSDADITRGSAANAGSSFAQTAAFATDANDLCICGCSTYGDGSVAVGGRTDVFNSGDYRGQYLLIGTKAGAAGTTTMQGPGTSPSVGAMPVKGSTAGGGISVPVALHQRKQQGFS